MLTVKCNNPTTRPNCLSRLQSGQTSHPARDVVHGVPPRPSARRAQSCWRGCPRVRVSRKRTRRGRPTLRSRRGASRVHLPTFLGRLTSCARFARRCAARALTNDHRGRILPRGRLERAIAVRERDDSDRLRECEVQHSGARVRAECVSDRAADVLRDADGRYDREAKSRMRGCEWEGRFRESDALGRKDGTFARRGVDALESV